MEVFLLDEREDGCQAYCVIFTTEELSILQELMAKHKMDDLSSTIESALVVGMEL